MIRAHSEVPRHLQAASIRINHSKRRLSGLVHCCCQRDQSGVISSRIVWNGATYHIITLLEAGSNSPSNPAVLLAGGGVLVVNQLVNPDAFRHGVTAKTSVCSSLLVLSERVCVS